MKSPLFRHQNDCKAPVTQNPHDTQKDIEKEFSSKGRRKVALKSPKYPLIRAILGDLRATFFVWEKLVLNPRVFCFRGWKSPQGLYNRSNLGTFKTRSGSSGGKNGPVLRKVYVFDLRSRRPATGVSRALRARSVPEVSPRVSPTMGGVRGDPGDTPSGTPSDTLHFWGHSRGHSGDTSGPKGPKGLL